MSGTRRGLAILSSAKSTRRSQLVSWTWILSGGNGSGCLVKPSHRIDAEQGLLTRRTGIAFLFLSDAHPEKAVPKAVQVHPHHFAVA